MARKGECIFCKNYGLLTREHIWADWLKKYIPKTMPNYRAGTMIVGRGGRVITRKKRIIGGDPRSRRVLCVCGSQTYGGTRQGCNDGWMKGIQDQVKPIVLPMIEGAASKLNTRQQRLLAAWIAMAVICSEYSDLDSLAIRQKDREWLFRKHAPPSNNWKIWIGHYENSKGQATLAAPWATNHQRSQPDFPSSSASLQYAIHDIYGWGTLHTCY